PAEAADEASVSVDDIISHLRNEVARSELPVPCARLAAQLMAARPGLAPDWLGQGSFRRFLESLALAPLTLDWRSSGGYLLDPTRHEVTLSGPLHGVPVSESSWGLDRLTLALIRQVHEATGVPMLSPREFRGLLDAIVADVAEQPFQLSETGKRVRDRCREQGLAVSRLDVNWVLRGVQMAGHAFGLGHDDLATLSYRLVGNLINLCRREQVALDEGSAAVLQRWVSGRFGEG
ncbi:MAG: NYN domain-containing protein, partial [Ideonella sp.]